MAANAPRPHAPPLWVVAAVDQLPAQALAAVRPELAGVAFAVIEQCEESYKAASLAMSPAARALGADPGTPVFVLRRKHGRRLRIVHRDVAAEQACRDHIRGVGDGWTPAHHLRGTRGRLEVFLDLTGTPVARRWGHDGIADHARQALLAATGLQQVAVGVSRSRLLAQVLARDRLPDSAVTCPPGAELEQLAGVAATSLPGLSPACRERARFYGIERVEQLLRCDRATLARRFGRDAGERLYGLVHGLAPEPRRVSGAAIEAETVLDEDLHDEGLLHEAVRLTADKACDALRQAGQVTRAVRLRVTWTDSRTSRKTVRLPVSTDAFASLHGASLRLFDELHTRRVAVKAVAVAALRTSPVTGQRDLFDGAADQRARRLGAALTDIRRRMGFDAVLPAGAVELAQRR